MLVAAVFAVVAVTMFARDLLNTAVVVFIGRRRVWLAGSCDAVCDLAALFTLGLTGAKVLEHGALSEWSAAAMAGLVVGSILGTRVGFALADHLGAPPAEIGAA